MRYLVVQDATGITTERAGLARLDSKLIASVQASFSELNDPETLLRLAQVSISEGVQVLRLEGVETIRHIKASLAVPIIGLIKRHYEGSDVYITPTSKEVEELVEVGCEYIALDCTDRSRPYGSSREELIRQILQSGRVAVADCDTVEAAVRSFETGALVVGTTLAGYTSARAATFGPDLELVRELSRALEVAAGGTKKLWADYPEKSSFWDELRLKGRGARSNATHMREATVVAEGRYEERWQVEAALRAGASAVVVGGALNDPAKNTRRLMPAVEPREVAAVDIGGTWVRAASFTKDSFLKSRPDKGPQRLMRRPLPKTRRARLACISEFLESGPVNRIVKSSTGELWESSGRFSRIGISSAGVVWNNKVTLSKDFIPENEGTDYNELRKYLGEEDDRGVYALGDGHASAWAHACHPDFAGKDLVVIAIGTGVGFGHVRQGKIVMGPTGEYSRLNDLPTDNGKTFEQILGGLALTSTPTKTQILLANKAFHRAVSLVSTLLFPDVIIVCGAVGMQDWLDLDVPALQGWPTVPLVRSPFGADAGLYGAAALALWPPF